MDDHTVMGRAVAVLDAVAASAPASLTALTEATGLPRSTAYRIAEDLCRRGVLDKRDGIYHLGARLVSWGSRALGDDRLRQAAYAHMWDLHHRSGEFAWVTRVDADTIDMIDKTFGPQVPWRMTAGPFPPEQQRAGLLHSAGGRAAIAGRPDLVEHLIRGGVPRPTPYAPTRPDQIRDAMARCHESGYSTEHEHFMLGWRCVAAPITDAEGRVCGVIGITGRGLRFGPQRYAEHVRRSADEITRTLPQAA